MSDILFRKDIILSCAVADTSYKSPPKPAPAVCNCCCDGWAEILIRKPTGNLCWMMKIENGDKLSGDCVDDLAFLVANLDGKKFQEKLGLTAQH